ncbi:lysylphosphatidylglycerol synthase transmembrane domain-containing protein [Desulfurella sp.]|uniref:lysylphosphatidylglycerol synthase transmembrane domain-containing protein n=1 Tax=Desulfurella sp. TaxID=1962857 RepID=UPI003D0F9436
MKKFFILLVILFLIISAIGFFSDFKKAVQSLEHFDKIYLIGAAIFGFGNDFIKFFRWHLYIKKLSIKVNFFTDLKIFLCGLAMSVTPVKFGYTIKNYIIENLTKTPFKRTLSATFAEIYVDFLILSVISLIGMFYLQKFSILGATLIIAVSIIFYPKIFKQIFIKLRTILPYTIRKYYVVLKDMVSFFTIGLFSEVILITILAWTSEGVSLSLILKGFGYNVNVIKTTVIFNFATLVGSLSMLPGGLIVSDLTLFGLLVYIGIPVYISLPATILARICTLWLSVIVGNTALFVNRKAFFGVKK